MSGNPTEQVKDTLYAVANTSTEWARENVVEPVRAYVNGEKSSNDKPTSNISPEESEQIDNLEKEKVEQFLQAKNESITKVRRKRNE
ncbi:hypothetical protein BJY04DRAFT_221156 [Aspergillus karnatakaensis]|uniref:uncharacterized protein n=1 Tax=Aspergillus karnatakaensis TaxID=1810916 RepID=UPI003CCDE24A